MAGPTPDALRARTAELFHQDQQRVFVQTDRAFAGLMIFQWVADTFSADADRRGLALVVTVGTSVPRRVRADGARLGQVLRNLVGNALKFTDDGEVELSVDAAVPAGPDTVALRFAVRDTGIGIPRDEQGAIFEAFTQAHTAGTRAYGGTGLGLAIAQRLVGLMGGRVIVQSTTGQGSTFSFSVTLPLVAPAAAARPQRAASIASYPSRKVG